MAAAAAAAPAPPPFDAVAQTWDVVVRAVAHSGFLPQAAKLMLASREHRHDLELLGRTQGVRGELGRTLLMHAVVRGEVARATEILGACPTPAARAELLACVDVEGNNALHLACSYDEDIDEEAALQLVELLLANGADPLAPRRNPATGRITHAINFAADWSARLVTPLVQAGASIDGGVAGESTLLYAARAGTARAVRMIPQLVALGARETLGNFAMVTLAYWPVEGVQPSGEEMMTAGAALMSVGCSATASNAGRTPADVAAKRGNVPMLRALQAMGAVPPATRTRLLVQGAAHPAILRVLLAAGAPPNALAAVDGAPAQSPLMAAAEKYELESVKVLLAGGASVDFPDGAGRTALMHCVGGDGCDPRVVSALIKAGADVNARDAARAMALHIVAAYPRPWAAAVARLLLDAGADARATDAAGRTPLARVADLYSALYQVLQSAGA